jgi:hypothetical protein
VQFCGICETGLYALKHHVLEDQRLGVNVRSGVILTMSLWLTVTASIVKGCEYQEP